MLPGRLWKTAGPAGSAAAAAAVGSFRGVKHSRGRTKESKAGGIILVNTGEDIRNLLYREIVRFRFLRSCNLYGTVPVQ